MSQTNVDPSSPMAVRVKATGKKGGGQPPRSSPTSRGAAADIQPSFSHLVPEGKTEPHAVQKSDTSSPKASMNERASMEAGRRYGKDTDNDSREPDMDEDDPSFAQPYVDLATMKGQHLRAHALRTFGVRYADNETDDSMRSDIQKRMAMKTGMQRYRG